MKEIINKIYYVGVAFFRKTDACIFIHGICSGYILSLQSFECVCEDRS